MPLWNGGKKLRAWEERERGRRREVHREIERVRYQDRDRGSNGTANTERNKKEILCEETEDGLK